MEGSKSVLGWKPIVVHEGDNVWMRCAATGIPKPEVEWRTAERSVIQLGSWQISPLIRIRNQMVGASNGSTALLKCEVEAFPEALRYCKAVMQLKIINISTMDFEVDPCLVTPLPLIERSGVAVYGVQLSDHKCLIGLCPPVPTCPDCPDLKELKCSNPAVSYYELRGKLVVRPFGKTTYPGLSNRATDCVLYAVGKPVYHRFTDQQYGCWKKNPLLRPYSASEKIWGTRENSTYILYVFATAKHYCTL